MENKYYSKNNLIGAFLIGLLVGLGAYYLVDNSDAIKITKKNADKEDTSNVEITENIVNIVDKIEVRDQPAGLRVDIDSVVLSNGGWVVVHESVNGKPQSILGAQRFDAGTWDGSIDLLRNTEEGGMYYVMLHTDNGDKKFDHLNDLPLKLGGKVVLTTFYAIRIR